MADSQIPKSKKVCQVEGCNKAYYAKGYCQKHWRQIHQHGYILERTTLSPNNFIIEDDVCRIELFDKNGNKTCDAIIDTEDFNLVKNKKWNFHKAYFPNTVGYVETRCRDVFVRLQKFLLGAKKHEMVDHRDRNTLNNRRSNLRFCTKSQNMMNKRVGKNNKSGTKNVSWSKSNEKWRVNITVNKIRYHLGCFAAFADAEKIAVAARRKYHGKFACHK